MWERVKKTADPLRKAAPRPAPPPKPALTRPEAPSAPDPLPRFEVGAKVDHSRDHDLVAGLSQRLAATPPAMDRKTHTRLKRGKMRPEGRLDLHGMTLSEAHPELLDFILRAHAAGKRLVLVITGKGKPRDRGGPIPTRTGVLRHQVPQWLRMQPLAPLVLDIAEAHVSHGGHGAFYVYLRRRR